MLDFGRIVTAMVTPFDQQLQIDWDRTGLLIDYLIEEQKSDSIIICGTTGEAPTLSDDEKLKLFEYAVKRANGRCGVIAGTGTNDTAHSVELSRRAEELGVDGVLLVAPYYNRPTQEGLYQHFRTIAESITIPVMTYNVPKRTGVNISVETTLRLAEIPNITSTKEASADLDQISRIVSGAKEGFKVYSGDDSLTLPILSVGGYGVVSVTSHVIGKRMSEMIEAFIQGRTSEAARIHGELMPIFSGMFICPNPVPVKAALALHGQDVGQCRLPLVPPTEQEEAFIQSLFANNQEKQ